MVNVEKAPCINGLPLLVLSVIISTSLRLYCMALKPILGHGCQKQPLSDLRHTVCSVQPILFHQGHQLTLVERTSPNYPKEQYSVNACIFFISSIHCLRNSCGVKTSQLDPQRRARPSSSVQS